MVLQCNAEVTDGNTTSIWSAEVWDKSQLTWGLYTVSRKEIQLTLYDLLSVYSPGSSSRLRVCSLLIVTKITEMLCRFIS